MKRLRSVVPVLVLVALVGAACGGSGAKSSSSSSSGDTAASVPDTSATGGSGSQPDESATTLPAGAVAGLDDYDGDGRPDPTCGTEDFGAGLVLRVPCAIDTANEPEQGARLVPDSLYRLPGSTDIDLEGISGSLVLARDAAGAKVVIVFNNSDALFETGSAAIGSTGTLDAVIRLLNGHWPRSTIQVRGHTDSTGTASLNQTLSERRASTVADYLRAHGLSAAAITSVGLGSTQRVAEERRPDGSDSPEGRRFNRRVEIVVRPPG